MRALMRELTFNLLAAAIVGAVAYVIYRQVKGDVLDKIPDLGQVAKGAGDIFTGLPGLIASKVKGESEDAYITFEEQRRRAEAALLAKRFGA